MATQQAELSFFQGARRDRADKKDRKDAAGKKIKKDKKAEKRDTTEFRLHEHLTPS